MQHIATALEALDHFTVILERSPFSALVLICLTALLMLGLGFAVLGYVVHKLR